MRPYTISTWIQYTNRDVRPSCCIGLHRGSLTQDSQAYAAPIAAVISPVRSRKKAGELVQKSERGYGDGRNDATHAPAASAAPVRNSRVFSRASDAAVRTPSMASPITAPPNTNPAQGKNTKLVSPLIGRI